MRHTSVVTEEDCRPVDGVDPSAPGYGAHLPFYAILQRCGFAWREFLSGLPSLEYDTIVPRVAADFLAEVGVGELDIDVSLAKVATSSFTLLCEVSQAGAVAARVEVVLVRFDYSTRATSPLSDEQREFLNAR